MGAAERLRRRADFLRCYRRGSRHHGPLAILYATPNQLAHPRLGITASRKVGGAVVRVRLKRRIREIYRRWSERRRLPPVDLVVHLKPAAAEASFDQLRRELERLLRRTLREPRPAS
ncbi:MAG: ribonuclease P protein component [Thermoanaerobaculia bacterium]|nr:ribonuclease P protein component [Thermoanaerobaculia bacterium]